MKYFIMQQDKRIVDAVYPVNINIPRQSFKKVKAEDQDNMAIQCYVRNNPQIRYIDFLEHPVPLVSDRVKQLMEKYEEGLFFKPVVLADPKQMRQDLYWVIIPNMVECLSSRSEFHKTGTIKHLIIDSKKVGGIHIFRIAESIEDQILVSLKVAESLLRHEFMGIGLKQVETL